MEDVRTLRYDIQWDVFEGMQIVDINSKHVWSEKCKV